MNILEMVNKNALWYIFFVFYVIILTHAKKQKSYTTHPFLLVYSHNHFYNPWKYSTNTHN